MAWQRTPTDDELRELLATDRPWFQGWEIRPGISVPGPNDIVAIMDRAGVSHDLSGKRVLDIGAYNGCVSLECERRGASEVMALDLMSSTATGFDDLAAAVGSEVVWQNGTIYQLDPAIHGTFDVVICFGVLYHLRWPLLGIDRMRSVATGDVYLESHVIDRRFVHPRRWMRWLKEKELRFSSVPMWRAYAARELHPEDASNFFGPNTHAVIAALDDVGITATCTGMWDDRASFAGTVRAGNTRQHEVYEALHPHTAALMGIPLMEDPLF
jgi:tRNA (mo5U34)-methyltransferase